MNIVKKNPQTITTQPYVIHLQGRLDANQVAREKNRYIDEVTRLKQPLVLSLSEVSFIDSTGLGFLVAMQQAQASVGKGFAICALTDKTRLLLELTRLNMVFDIYETESMAIEALTNSPGNLAN